MLSLLELIDRTTPFFEQRGVPNPRLQVELLAAHVLGCKRLDLYLRFDQPMTEEVLDRLRPLVRRRGEREPLQYIIGDTPFQDLTLKCDRRALIPRPETEQLVDEVASRQTVAPSRILDLGTGTGALALALAQRYPEAEVVAVDASTDALSLARENAQAHGLERVKLLKSDWFSAVQGAFDLIVSNPPYLTDEEWEEAEPEVKQFEPRSALTAPDEGCADLLTILETARDYLKAGGMVALETGIDQHARLARAADELGYQRHESAKDLSERPRYFFAWR